MIGLRLGRRAAVLVLAASCAATFACGGSSLEGTYTNASGQATLDIKAGDQASFTVLGDTQTCSYTRDAAKLTLTCPGQQTFDFSIASDGSLTSENTFIGALKKGK
jgi:hypothetical protein